MAREIDSDEIVIKVKCSVFGGRTVIGRADLLSIAREFEACAKEETVVEVELDFLGKNGGLIVTRTLVELPQ